MGLATFVLDWLGARQEYTYSTQYGNAAPVLAITLARPGNERPWWRLLSVSLSLKMPPPLSCLSSLLSTMQ